MGDDKLQSHVEKRHDDLLKSPRAIEIDLKFDYFLMRVVDCSVLVINVLLDQPRAFDQQ